MLVGMKFIYGFRIPNDEITEKLIKKMNIKKRKYERCLLGVISGFKIELNVKYAGN